jgi:PPM family protein phosphatase
MKTYAVSDRGLNRKENQDRYALREFDDGAVLAAVADGMGGEAGGGQAAQIAIETLTAFSYSLFRVASDLKKLFHSASEKVAEAAQINPELTGLGTTLTAAYIKKGKTYWAHVGDSRLYLFRAGELIQVTEDQTFVNLLVKEGTIKAGEVRGHPLENILTQCIGCPPLRISSGRFEVAPGDLVLLSTDGLHHEIKEEKMAAVLSQKTDLREKCQALLRAALAAGGRDNVTIVAVLT